MSYKSSEAKPLTQSELKKFTCSSPGCVHNDHNKGLFFNQLCHTGKGLDVEFIDDRLNITCSVCSKFVAAISVQET